MKPTVAVRTLKSTLEGPVLRALLKLPETPRRLLTGRAIERDGLRLDPEMQTILRVDELMHEPALPDLSIAKARIAMVRQARIVGGRQPIGDVVDRDLPGAGGRIPIRAYTPRGLTGVAPALVFFHGGAWVYGGLESHDALCRFLAEAAGVRVVAVAYRLAPEHRFPAAVDDALAAYDWIHEHAAQLEIDASRLAVGGDSAGGNLATNVARERRESTAPAFQLLVYPSTRVRATTASAQLFAEGFYLSKALMDLGVENFVPPGADVTDPRLSPLLADDVTGMCPAYVATAGFDPLRDEGETYADKLRAAGVPVELRRFDGLIHGFANMVGAGRSGPAAMREVAAALRRALVPSSQR